MMEQPIKPCQIFPLNWLQGSHRWIDYSLPWSFYTVGDVDTGKGNTLFALATRFLAKGGFVVDTFGSDNDSETLSWLSPDSPYRNETAVVTSDLFKGNLPFNHFKISDFSISKAKEYKVVVTDKIFFEDSDDHMKGLAHIFKTCRERRGYKLERGNPILALVVREARKIIKSQMSAHMTRDEQDAQYAFVDLNAQRAHSGVSPLVDSQRWMDVHNSYRDLASFKIFKGFGPQVIPGELHWLFKRQLHYAWRMAPFRRKQPWPSYLRNMPVNHFVAVTRWNGVCTGLIEKVPWVKYKGSDLMDILKIEPSFEVKEDAKEAEKSSRKSKVLERLTYHRRILELEASDMKLKDIAKHMEAETQQHFTEGMVKYHTEGKCNCEYDAGKAEERK